MRAIAPGAPRLLEKTVLSKAWCGSGISCQSAFVARRRTWRGSGAPTK